MLSDGSSIDVHSLLKLKLRLAQLLGISGALWKPSANRSSSYIQLSQFNGIPDHASPCIEGLGFLLDATFRIGLSASSMMGNGDDNTTSVLIGSSFVDIILYLFDATTHILDLPFVTLKSLIHILTTVIYKHDLDVAPLRHLREPLRKAVRRVTSIVNSDTSLELRQLSLSVCHAYIRHCGHYAVAHNFLV